MVSPVNLQLAHWNLEHAAQQNRDPAAAAAQAGKQGEGMAAAVQRDSSVQVAEHTAEEERLGHKKRRDEEDDERKRKKKNLTLSDKGNDEEDATSSQEKGRLDFYA